MSSKEFPHGQGPGSLPLLSPLLVSSQGCGRYTQGPITKAWGASGMLRPGHTLISGLWEWSLCQDPRTGVRIGIL